MYFWGRKFWYPKNTILGCVGVLTHDIFGNKNTTNAWEQCSFVFFHKKNQFLWEKNMILGCVSVFTQEFHSNFVRKKSMRAGYFGFFLQKKPKINKMGFYGVGAF